MVGNLYSFVFTLRQRYGTVSFIALLGLFPFFPVSSIIGVGAGIAGLALIRKGREPRTGIWPCILGIALGLMWFALGLLFVDRLAAWLSVAFGSFFQFFQETFHDSDILLIQLKEP
jgi:hypothetical protein